MIRADLEKSKFSAPDHDKLRPEDQDYLPRIKSSLADVETPGIHKVNISVMSLNESKKDSREATPNKSIKSRER